MIPILSSGWDGEPSKLSPKVLSICNDPTNTLIFSVVSAWEMQIKAQLGKLTLRLPLADIISSQQTSNHVQILPCDLNHVMTLDTLPLHHKDPFDRLLISQAIAENAILLTKDQLISQYQVDLEW